MPSSSSTSLIITAVAGGAITAAVAIWRISEKKSNRRKSATDSENDSSSTTVSVEGSVMATLPTWAISSSPSYFSKTYKSDEEMMSLAIHLSDRNITEGTGGPFGAAIFERHANDNCTLISIGMNRVVPLCNSTLHGEMLAIQLAQRKVGSFTLMVDFEDDNASGVFIEEKNSTDQNDSTTSSNSTNNRKKRQFELFTSCEPCAMCLGATLWSGVSRIVCAATKDDAQSIGFDEGPVYKSSYDHLVSCGVQVTRNVMREEAASVLKRYGSSGLIYNR